MASASTSTSVSQIVAQLKAAADAYYNGGKLLMDDETYDALTDRLREMDPTNSFLGQVGTPPSPSGCCRALPHPMPSLDKIKPGQDSLTRFLGAGSKFLLSEKLDGLSALWIPATGNLYLRGDGIVGQDISHLATKIQGLKRPFNPCAIRGEILVRRTDVSTLSRSWVNGLIHQKEPKPEEVRKLRFVAYDLLEPAGLTRTQQMTWLQNQAFEVPWLQGCTTAPTTEHLAEALLARRRDSPYDTDGIVVAYDVVPTRFATPKNPKDAVAFKMPLSDQSAVTTLREVLWAPSAQGYLVPRLRFDPVTISGAQIEFCTGHNARTIVEKGLGPGAQIRIRRSGDVIPTLDAVLVPAAEAALPADRDSWEWVSGSDRSGSETAATHIKAKTETDAQLATQLQNFFNVLAIPSMGPSNCEALIKAGIRGPKALWAATKETLATTLGPKTGATLYENLRTAMKTATESKLMIASSKLPRGVGDAKLKALFKLYPDPRRWGGGNVGEDRRHR